MPPAPIPSVVMQDLLDLTHWLTRVKLVPQAAEAPGVPEAERVRGSAMAGKLVDRPCWPACWQMLLKGLGEVQSAPQPLQAAEMVLIRLTHAADLPPPADLVRQLQEGGGSGADRTGAGRAPWRRSRADDAGASAKSPPVLASSRGDSGDRPPRHGPAAARRSMAAPGVADAAPSTAGPRPIPRASTRSSRCCSERREAILHAHLKNNVHLVRFEPGRLEIPAGASRRRANLANRLGALLGGMDRPALGGRRLARAGRADAGRAGSRRRTPQARAAVDGPSPGAGGAGGLPRRHDRSRCASLRSAARDTTD